MFPLYRAGSGPGSGIGAGAIFFFFFFRRLCIEILYYKKLKKYA